MSKLVVFVTVIFVVFALSVAVHRDDRHGNNVDDIAHWALDEIGPGYQLIKVRKVKRQHVDGTLYHLTLKVRTFRPGGFSEKKKCIVKVLVYDNYKTLQYHRCFETGRRGSRIGSQLP